MKRLLAMVLSIAAVAASACQQVKEPPVAAATVADSADQVLEGIEFLLATKGIQRADLRADSAYILEDQTRFDLRNAHVKFTTETGMPQGTMDARRGVYSTRTQVLEGWGDVVVHLVDGRTLKSPHVVYNQTMHTIRSDTSYTITRNGDSQNGIGFQSNESFTSFNCLKACGGKFSVLLPER